MGTKYDLNDRLRWIKSLVQNHKMEEWFNKPVYHPSDIKYSDFFEESNRHTSLIDPSRIVGVEYGFGYNCPSYNRKTYSWINHLENLKRLDWVIDNKGSKEELVEHIHLNNDPKSVWKYGNHYFVTSGQHRLCLAKFLGLKGVEVSVREFKLNKRTFVREKHFESHKSDLIKYKFVSPNFQNNNAYDKLFITVNGTEYYLSKTLITELLSRYENLQTNTTKALIFFIRRFLLPVYYDHNKVISNARELSLIDCDLIAHIRNAKNTA